MASVSSAVEEVPIKTDRKHSPAKGLLRRGFFGAENYSPSSPKVKEASSSILAAEEDSSTSSKKMGPSIANSQAISKAAYRGSSGGASLGAAKLGMRLRLSHPGMMESGAPIYSYVSKSQLGYSLRVKNNTGKQLKKNKKLLTEVVVDTPVVGVEGYSEVVLDTMELAPTLGLTYGVMRKAFLNLFLVIENDRYCEEGVFASNTKRKSELKNFGMLH